MISSHLFIIQFKSFESCSLFFCSILILIFFITDKIRYWAHFMIKYFPADVTNVSDACKERWEQSKRNFWTHFFLIWFKNSSSSFNKRIRNEKCWLSLSSSWVHLNQINLKFFFCFISSTFLLGWLSHSTRVYSRLFFFWIETKMSIEFPFYSIRHEMILLKRELGMFSNKKNGRWRDKRWTWVMSERSLTSFSFTSHSTKKWNKIAHQMTINGNLLFCNPRLYFYIDFVW